MRKNVKNSESTDPVKKERVLHLRVTDNEYGQIAADADAARLSMSAYLRRRALGHPVMTSTDAAMLRELRRQGELVKYTIIKSGGIAAQDASAAYQAIVALIEKIAARMEGSK